MVPSLSLPSRVVLKYYLYKMTTAVGFTLPIIVLFLEGRGLSLAQVGLLNGVYSAVVILGETPTGYVADRVGRRNTLLASIALLGLGNLLLIPTYSFLAFAFVYALLGLGRTFQSGTASAWLYDVLAERTAEDEFTRITGRGRSMSQVVTAVSAAVAGFLADLNMAYPFVAEAALASLGFFVVLSFPSSQGNEGDDADDDESESLGVLEALSLLRRQLFDRSLRSFILYTVLFYSTIAVAYLLVQPASVAVGIEVEHIGLLYAAFTGVGAVAGYFAGEIRDLVGIRRWVHFVPFAVAISFIAVWVHPYAAILAFFVMKVGGEVTGPMQKQYVNDHAESAGRATTLSALSMVSSLVLIPFEYAGGALADAVGAVEALPVLGVVLLVGSVVVFVLERPVAESYGRAEAGD